MRRNIWDLIQSNPVSKTRLPRRGPGEDKVLPDPAQVQNLLRNLQEPSRTVATLLVLTGLRVGEGLALRVKDLTSIRESFGSAGLCTKATLTSPRRGPADAWFRLVQAYRTY